MLKQLRKKGVAKKILWITTVIIILSFGVFWNTNRISRQSITYAGKIFGKKISFNEFQKSLLYARNQNLLRYGENFYKISQFLNLESEAWDWLILLYEAKKRNIKILDQEVVDSIEDFDFFKDNGKFDPAVYNKVVRYVFRCEPREFEEGVRETLIFSKLFEQETSAVTISEEELLKEYKKQNEKVQVSYAFFSAEDYTKDVTVDPKEAENYFNAHKNNFTLPLTINLEYIFLSLPAEAKDEEKNSLKNKIESITAELKAEPNLEKISKKYNFEIKESGFFSQEEANPKIGLPLEVLQKAFNLEENEISNPLETSKGFYILKLKNKKESHPSSFDEVQDKVKEVLTKLKAKDTAKQKSSDYLKQINDVLTNNPQASFADTVKNLGLKIEQTPLFHRGEYLPTLGLSSDFQESAFSLNDQNKISNVIETKKGYCILYFDNFQPIDKEKFSKEKDNFAKNLANDKKNEIFSEFVGKLRLKANLEDNISKLKKNNLAD